MANIEMVLGFDQPVTDNDTRTISGNSIMLHNAGQQTVYLDKHWEIPPGGTFSFGSTENPLIMFSQRFRIGFSGAGTKKLQIAIVTAKSRAVANYSESKKEVRL